VGYEEVWEVRTAHSFKMSKEVIEAVIQKSGKFQCLPSSYLFSLEALRKKKKRKKNSSGRVCFCIMNSKAPSSFPTRTLNVLQSSAEF